LTDVFLQVINANANMDLFAIHAVATSFLEHVRPLDVSDAIDVPADRTNLLWAQRRSPFRIAMRHVVHP